MPPSRMRLEPVADNRLRGPGGFWIRRQRIDIGGVDEVDARLPGVVQYRERSWLITLVAKSHRTQAYFADPQPGTAHPFDFHVCPFLKKSPACLQKLRGMFSVWRYNRHPGAQGGRIIVENDCLILHIFQMDDGEASKCPEM